MATKFENLDEEIQVLVKVYYGSAVMLNKACSKYYNWLLILILFSCF